MTRLVYIVRHGNTFDAGDTVLRVGGRTDLPLSQSGREQAARLGAHFAETGVRFSEAITGPLLRTRETAEAILATQTSPPLLHLAESLREIDYGPDEGRPEDEVVARIGADALTAWEAGSSVPPGWLVDPQALERDWLALFDVLSIDNSDPVLVVTSNGIARFALSALDGAGEHEAKLKTGAYGMIELDGSSRKVVKWNSRP